MLNENTASKTRVTAARKLIKQAGAEVLGWNDKPGKEFISIQADGDDTLVTAQKAMEAAGWHVWPQDNQDAGLSMDFSLQAPPAGMFPSKDDSVSSPAILKLVQSGLNFRYCGPGSCFPSQWLGLAGLASAFVFIQKHSPNWSLEFRMFMALGVFIFLSVILLWLNWLEIYAGDDKVVIRKHYFGRPREIPIADFKRIQIYTDQDRRGRKTKFTSLAIDLKQGKSFNVFLPKKAEAKFYSFIRKRIRSDLSP